MMNYQDGNHREVCNVPKSECASRDTVELTPPPQPAGREGLEQSEAKRIDAGLLRPARLQAQLASWHQLSYLSTSIGYRTGT